MVPLKDKKGITITNTFQKFLDETDHKPCKTWVDKVSEFYNRPIKSWLQDNDVEMYSVHNEEKLIVVERYIGTLKNKIYKCMTLVSKSMYTDKLDEIINKYNNTYNRNIKMKSADVKPRRYIEFGIENNDKGPKFKVGDHVRISKCKKSFCKKLHSKLVCRSFGN